MKPGSEIKPNNAHMHAKEKCMKGQPSDFTPSEERSIAQALSNWLPPPPAHEAASDHARDLKQTQKRADSALRRADLASRRGDLAAAKRWSDVAAKLTESVGQLSEAAPRLPEDEEEAQREELCRRLAQLADSDLELQRWHMRREIWEEMAAEARRTGSPTPPPMPPRPAHWTDSLSDDLRQHLEQA
jgi:hypothetical protein